jgi:hypothetical protein
VQLLERQDEAVGGSIEEKLAQQMIKLDLRSLLSWLNHEA